MSDYSFKHLYHNGEDRSRVASGFFDNSSGEGIRRLKQMALVSHCRELERLAVMQRRVARHYFRLLDANRRLRVRAAGMPKSFGTMLADAMDAERQRIGRELHTGVGQSLAGIHVHASLIESTLPHPPESVRKSLDLISSLAAGALEQVRGVSRRLYVPAWQAQPLVEALRSLWDNSGIAEKFAGTLALDELSTEPSLEVRRALYLAAQEGLANAIQHADAGSLSLSLCEQRNRITLIVEDDGAGFGPPTDLLRPPASAGIGLRALRDLVHELGGELHAEGGPQGTRLTISFLSVHE